jgi:hypothetical protein
MGRQHKVYPYQPMYNQTKFDWTKKLKKLKKWGGSRDYHELQYQFTL